MTAYDRLTDRFTRIATIGEAGAVLGWDAAVMMPQGGGAARGRRPGKSAGRRLTAGGVQPVRALRCPVGVYTQDAGFDLIPGSQVVRV